MSIYSFDGQEPEIHPDTFIAADAAIIGDVKIGEKSSVWYNCVLRGDVHRIVVGSWSNIQDATVCHVTTAKFDLQIGNYVTIGHAAILHGCRIEDYTLIGMGAKVLDGAIVEPESIVAAGALVKEGFTVPGRHLVAGVPAKIIRPLSEQEIAYFEKSAKHYYELGQKHRSLVFKK